MKLNTIFQLFAVKQFQEHILKETRAMLLVPDLLNYFLTGRMASSIPLPVLPSYWIR